MLLHLFAGPKRSGDVEFWINRLKKIDVHDDAQVTRFGVAVVVRALPPALLQPV